VRGPFRLEYHRSTFQVEITRRKPSPEDLARRRSDHSSKSPREVGRIRKAGGVSRGRDRLAQRELTRTTLQAQPEDVRT
jgi:hypothetical protein